LVFDQKILLNEGGMTWPNEPARHKLVDAMGDLSLAGAAIMGHFHGHRSGHALNHQILTKLLSDKSAWHWG
jgi:UDP-3-O-[3-hydroxymyristoyl] N-acetylglucosamine deacetylase